MDEFKEGDKIIWNSGWGYEVGIFKGEGNQYSTYLVDMHSGTVQGLVSHPKDEIYRYNEELQGWLTRRYGYSYTL